MEQNQQSTAEQYSEQIEQLMELGRTQGYLTYAEINDLLPEDLIDPEYYDKLLILFHFYSRFALFLEDKSPCFEQEILPLL